MIIRKATIKDLKAITAVEATCFPPAEAASRSNFKKRLKTYPNHFWLLEDEGKLISFINGMVTNETTINDIMFEDASLHDEAGEWQAIFGVNTIPEYRQQGLAAKVMQVVIDGRCFEIEIKASRGRLSELQRQKINQINSSRGKAYVLKPENFNEITAILKEHL